MKNKELYKLLMDYAITVTLRNKYDKGKYYDAGKYGCHFEHIEGDFYGCYYQIEDSPFGDLWGMFIYRISEKGIFL